MRIYNPQNQFGKDLITKEQVTLITGLEGLKDGKNIDTRLLALEGGEGGNALKTVTGDETDGLVKIKFTKNEETRDSKATLTVAKAKVEGGVISGDGIATGTQVATAIKTEKDRAEAAELAITNDIGSWTPGEGIEGTVRAAIEANKRSINELSSITGFEVVTTLPTTDIKSNTIYLKKVEGAEGDQYEEWIYVTVGAGKQWEKLGNAGLDLKSYYKKDEIDTKIGADCKTADLTTEAKGTLVAAINEVDKHADDNAALLGTTSDTSDKATAFGYIAKEAEDRATAISGLRDTTVTSTDGSEAEHVKVDLGGKVGAPTVTVTTYDIASANLLGTKDDTKTSETAFGYIAKEADARATAISTLEGTAVSSTSTDTHVTVTLGGTVKAPTVAVTTDDIASADDLTALDTYIKQAGTEEGGVKKGGIEPRLAAVEASIGEGGAIEKRVDDLEAGLGDVSTLTTTAKTAVGAINELDGEMGNETLTTTATTVKGAINELDAEIGNIGGLTTTVKTDLVAAINSADSVAKAAVQDITGDESKSVKVKFTEDGSSHNVTTEVTITEAGTTGADDELVIDTTTEKALVTAKVAADAIAAAEARAKALSDAAQAEAEKAHADAQGIMAQSIVSVGTVIECAVAAGQTSGTFNVTMPTGIEGHVMRVCWKGDDFVCQHGGTNAAPTVTLWSGDVPEGAVMPAAGEITVFVRVTKGTEHAHA